MRFFYLFLIIIFVCNLFCNCITNSVNCEKELLLKKENCEIPFLFKPIKCRMRIDVQYLKEFFNAEEINEAVSISGFKNMECNSISFKSRELIYFKNIARLTKISIKYCDDRLVGFSVYCEGNEVPAAMMESFYLDMRNDLIKKYGNPGNKVLHVFYNFHPKQKFDSWTFDGYILATELSNDIETPDTLELRVRFIESELWDF